jgi:hypothetical protein
MSDHTIPSYGLGQKLLRSRRSRPAKGLRANLRRAGWPWRLPARAPTDPDVHTLAHPVLQPTDSPAAMAPEAIRSSYVDMLGNLDVFRMFPSTESAGRRFAFLHRVLRGEFPCFVGTIKALRLPAAHPAALRYLRLAVPQSALALFAPWWTSAPPRPGVGNPVSPAGNSAEETAGSRKFLGNLDCPFAHVQSTPAGLPHQTIAVQQRRPWYVKSKGSRERSFGAQ